MISLCSRIILTAILFYIRKNGGSLLLAIGLVFFPSSHAATQKVELDATEFKAAILSKIPKYIQWPGEAASSLTNRIVVAVLGNDPITPLLREIFKTATFEGREARLIIWEPGQPLPKCQILFVPAAALPAWQALRKEFDPVGLLTVGESEDFLKIGGIMYLSVLDRKLWIHHPNAEKARIGIDSKLLRISKVIK